MNTHTLFILVIICCGFLNGSCSRSSWSPPPSMIYLISIDKIQGDWIISGFVYEELVDKAPKNDHPFRITIHEDGSINGFSGVNRFRGTIDVAALSEYSWVCSPIMTTEKSGPSDLMDIEQKILSALQGTSRLVYNPGDSLVFHRDKDRILFLSR